MIQIDMDMPKSCADCPCGNAQDGWCYVHNEVLERMENGYPSTETRPDWCPLIEVPTSYGDLIDADELIKKLEHQKEIYKVNHDWKSVKVILYDINEVKCMKTVKN